MPERPRSHILADEGVRKFAGAIEPALMFYERRQPEYGIDGDVEVFDAGGRATGLHFFAQVKGTDEGNLSEALTVTIEIDTADYYRAAPMPVLMVRYLAATASLYVRWFHQYDPYFSRGGEKTLTFRWQPEDEWKADMPARLAADARAFYELRRASLHLPQPLHVVTEGAFGVTPAEMRIALRAAAAERADSLSSAAIPDPRALAGSRSRTTR